MTILLMASALELSAQVTVVESSIQTEKIKFETQVKDSEVNTNVLADAQRRAERLTLRKERNSVDFTANLHGSLTAYSPSWQAAGDNTITILANLNFLHTYKQGRFTLTNTASAKLGYNSMKISSDAKRGTWFKNVDEIALASSPQWAMVKNWTYGANVKFRTQFAAGYESRGSKDRVSSFLTPGYFDASVGFTYVLPSTRFPLKINMAPFAMSATYRIDQGTSKDYSVPAGHKSKYEGGFSIQLDFDRSWGENGWLRYRTTAYSFYGWITDLSAQKKFKPTENKPLYEHVVPTLRWENTIDIKATKHISTQLYVQFYYNRAEYHKLQVQSMLSVGLTYTFKNK